MNFIIVLLILINVSLIIKAIPPVNHFFIEYNKADCAKLDLSADFTIYYNTNNGAKSAILNMSKSIDNQRGLCSLDILDTQVQFNISIPPTEKLVLNFINQNNSVELTSVNFIYRTPNENLPNADKNGTFIAYANPNVILSSTNNYFECNSRVHFNLTNGVVITVYSAKVKVFNVVNSSFGSDKEECSQDFNNSTTVFTTSFSSTTMKTLPSTNTINWSTYIPTTSNPTEKTAMTSDFTNNVTNPITTSPFTTSHISTYSSNFISTQPTNDFVYKVPPHDRTYCLLLKSEMEINITYNTTNNKNKTKTFNILSNASYSGSCSPNYNTLLIKWLSGLSINLIFMNTQSVSHLNHLSVQYNLSSDYFPDAHNKDQPIIIEKGDYSDKCQISITNSYKCSTLKFVIGTVSLTLSNFQYEAFQNLTSDVFSNTVITCQTINPLVAIIVGVVLAAFLIVVVIIFLIFRFRGNKRKGYEEI